MRLYWDCLGLDSVVDLASRSDWTVGFLFFNMMFTVLLKIGCQRERFPFLCK